MQERNRLRQHWPFSRTYWGFPVNRSAETFAVTEFGSSSRIRTYNPSVNSKDVLF